MNRSRSFSVSSVATEVRARVEGSGERVWRHGDFADLPPQAVGKALSRMGRAGELRRLSKGIYFRSRPTPFGESRPHPAALRGLAEEAATVFPAGLAAASLLGLTTQMPARAEVSTTASSLPRKLLGEQAIIHTRRPPAWERLSPRQAAVLEILRDGLQASELSPQETVQRLLQVLGEPGLLDRLLVVAGTEPPRVRAMLGALAETLGHRNEDLQPLRDSLNPLSRFEFSVLHPLPAAPRWQAKRRAVTQR